MGIVRVMAMRKLARTLIERFPEKFGEDFENNKRLLDELTNITSKRLRNRLAGYIVREIVRLKKG
ncbi:MAG: 30S ribosomal protein S17e [Candidatus Bathyarchaeia archaeon]